MARRVKVFSFTAFPQHWLNAHVPDMARQVELVVATTSKAAAIRAMGPYVDDSASWMSNRMNETSNADSLGAAMTEPGSVFIARDRYNPANGFDRLPDVSIVIGADTTR